MSRQMEEALREYLGSLGRLDSVNLGDSEGQESRETPSLPVAEEQGRGLARSVRRARRANGRLTALLIVLLLGVFGVAFYLALASGGINGTSATVGSGAVVALLGVIAALHRLWREKSMMDLLTAVLEESSPERSVDLIETVYWSAFAGRRGAGRG